MGTPGINICCCVALAIALLATAGALHAQKVSPPPRAHIGPFFWVYGGNYAKADKKGIYAFRLDASSGSLIPAEAAPAGIAADAESPNFLAVHPSGKFLYAVTATKINNVSGAVEAYAIDQATGKLTFLNRRASSGAEPVHIAIDPSGKVAAIANYTGGSVALLPIGDDGRLGEATAVIKHEGSSIDHDRQTKPFPHGVAFDATGKHLYVADLGTDEIVAYLVDPEKGTMTPDPAANGSVQAGAGPRHLAISKDGRFLYAVTEMGNTLDTFSIGDKGQLKSLQTLSPWPDAVKGKTYGAEVAVLPSGKFLYASDRGNAILAILAIDQDTGKLTPVGNISTNGNNPRHFGIDPTGSYLIAVNQKSNSLVMFQIDPDKGQLRRTGIVIDTPSPVCVAFVPAK